MKENQGTLYEDIQMLFEGFEEVAYAQVPHATCQRVAHGHDRHEIRQCWVVAEAAYRAYLRQGQQWKQLTSLVK